MSREMPLDPEIADELDAIDATLAGDPVDPGHAELAELALLLVADRPAPAPGFAESLDRRIAAGLAERSSRTTQRESSDGTAAAPRLAVHRRRRPLLALGGSLAAGVAALMVVIVIGVGSSGPSSSGGPTAESVTASQTQASPAVTAAGSSVAHAPSTTAPAPPRAAGSAAPSAAAGAAGSAAAAGRQVIQGAQLDLTASPTRVEDVASELFAVVGVAHGFVESSHVSQTGGSDGYARFQLSVPSANLAQVLAGLSQMRYATVSSRTDDTTDVTDQLGQDERRLGDARALRASLLRQLARATTPGQIDSLRGRLNDADAAITAAENTISSLRHQVSNSSVTVTVSAGSSPFPVSHGGGLTVGHALGDAGRVLGRIAGVAVLVLAIVLPPVAILAGLWWLAGRVRGRRRERALDAAA